MKNLRRGSKGPDVGKLQSFLKSKGYYIKVDNDYGPATALSVYWYQRNENLYADKKFGPACRRSMDKAGECKYQEIKLDRQTTVIRMNKHHTIGKVLNPYKQTLKQMFNSLIKKPTVVINGGLFNMQNMGDAGHLKVDGITAGWAFYDDDGLRIKRDGRISIGKDGPQFNDFMGFSPAVILKNKINTEYDDLSNSFVNSKHPRTMVQISGDYINVFIIRGRSWWRGWVGANISDLRKYAYTFAKYDDPRECDAGNLDGGYSTGGYTKRGLVFGWISRAVANGVAFYVEGF